MKRIFLALALALAFALATFGASAQTVTGPQACTYPQYVNGFDSSGTIICATVDFSSLSFSGLAFATNSSDSTLEASSGLTQVIALNDATGFKQNYTIQARNLNDPQCYLYGGIASIDELNQTITVATTVGIGGCTDNAWSVQVLAGPTIGVQASNTLGLSVDSFAIPAIGNTVSVTTGAGLYFKPGTSIIFTALSDTTQNFIGLSGSYNNTTGALSVSVRDVATGASGTYAAWGLNAQDGPSNSEALNGYSSTSYAIAYTSGAAFVWTGASGLQEGSLFYLIDRNNSANWMWCQLFASNSPGTGSFVVNGIGGSGTIADWRVLVSTGPLDNNPGGAYTPSGRGQYITFASDGGIKIANNTSGTFGSGLRIVNADNVNRALLFDIAGVAGSARSVTIPADATISGTNTGDQTITLSGDVSGTGTGAITTTIGATKVTSAMLNSDVFSTAHSWGGTQTFTAPVLGTPASGTLTNATGLPISTGLAGAGTGVLTALGVNVGSAGAFITFNGALGTPSSGVATNLTGTATGLTAGNATLAATVTTNANMTGDVTSVGNATTLAAGNAGNLNSGTLLAARMPALTGDVTTSAGAVATTLATVNSNVGSFGSSTSIPTFTVNGKGLITAASGNAVVAPAGTLTGGTLASGVTSSSLTSVGTLTGGATGAGFTVALSTSTLTGTISGTNIASSVALAGSPTTTTQAAADNSTKIATTAYADAAGGALSSKTVSFTKNLADATAATTAVTGVGFVPTSCTFFSNYFEATILAVNATGVVGSDKAGRASTNASGGTTAIVGAFAIILAATNTGMTRFQTAVVTTFDSDGFTLTWTKTSTPTGTITVNAICYK